jgi:hypothetical protein
MKFQTWDAVYHLPHAVFYDQKLLAVYPTFKLEDLPLSVLVKTVNNFRFPCKSITMWNPSHFSRITGLHVIKDNTSTQYLISF